jgi:hypothetical protein
MATFISALVFLGPNESIPQDQKNIYLFSLLGFGFLMILVPLIRGRSRQKGGDAAFLRGDYSTAKKEYKATKDLGASVKINLRLAFVEYAQNNNPSTLHPYFRDALSEGINYKSVEDLARKLNFKLDSNVYRVFREEEFEHLIAFLPIRAENFPNRTSVNNNWSTAIRIIRGPENFEGVWVGQQRSKLDINASLHEKADNRIDITVNEVCHSPSLFVTQWDVGGVGGGLNTSRLQYGEITDNALLSAIQKTEFDAKMYAELMQKDAVSVVRDVLNFTKKRRMINEIDSIRLNITKEIPVFWIERLKEGLFDPPGIKIRWHYWRSSLKINCSFHIAFSSIPKNPFPSDKLLKSLIIIEPSEIHLELPRL